MKKIEELKKEMLDTLPEKRYLHVLSVVETAEYMAEVFGLDKGDVMAAAVLHDCTKPLSLEEHVKLCEKYSLPLSEHDLRSEKVLHAKTGALVAKYFYHQSDEVCSMIYSHSTGKPDMTVEEKVIFLSDFIERTRQYDACKTARKKFLEGIEKAQTHKEKLRVLDTSVYEVLDFTLAYLEKKGTYIHPDTCTAKDYLSHTLFSQF